ncbi:MAG: YggS family pyridoxal phosphate-dependent enzyme, partial [Synechococcales cyanobacterium M58_A2018_015]|nr:YggS family pyridoxal phosphate-dependent enzyme [Synechococcales cyanobacterium M58_A2018_015]
MSSTSSINPIADRLEQIWSTLPSSVRLIAVTKQVPVELMRAAYEAGVRDFGESRIQEAMTKQTQLADLPDITWHFIGHLQTNKVARALDLFQWIHSVDSLKLAQQLNQRAQERQQSPKVCLQVKLLPDPQKYGWTEAELLEALPELDRCSHLQIVGLMTIPPYGLSQDETLAVFHNTRRLAEQIQAQSWSHLRMHHLSMGMSDDYQLAVQA